MNFVLYARGFPSRLMQNITTEAGRKRMLEPGQHSPLTTVMLVTVKIRSDVKTRDSDSTFGVMQHDSQGNLLALERHDCCE